MGLVLLLLLFGGFATAMATSDGEPGEAIDTAPPEPHPEVEEGASKPGPEIPRLTVSEKEKAEQIVLNDPVIQDILKDKDYEIGAIWVSHTGSVKTGAIVEIIFYFYSRER